MSALVLAIIITAAGCVLHFVFSRGPNPQPTLARLGDWFILAGAWSITAQITVSYSS
jgi:hypothetical protein